MALPCAKGRGIRYSASGLHHREKAAREKFLVALTLGALSVVFRVYPWGLKSLRPPCLTGAESAYPVSSDRLESSGTSRIQASYRSRAAGKSGRGGKISLAGWLAEEEGGGEEQPTFRRGRAFSLLLYKQKKGSGAHLLRARSAQRVNDTLRRPLRHLGRKLADPEGPPHTAPARHDRQASVGFCVSCVVDDPACTLFASTTSQSSRF